MGTRIGARVGEDMDRVQRTLTRHHGAFILAKADGKIIGTVWATYDGRRGWINHLCVHPDFRRGSIASTLLEKAEARLHEEGCMRVNLLIFPENEHDLQNYYARRGYGTYDLIFMYKELKT